MGAELVHEEKDGFRPALVAFKDAFRAVATHKKIDHASSLRRNS